MLSKEEWIKEKVVRWQGVCNSDTHTVEGGYLFVREDDGSITGLGTRNVSSRAEAIAYHYGLYVDEQNANRLGGHSARKGNMNKAFEYIDGMMRANMELYEKILDTPDFAFYFNELVKLAQSASQQSEQADGGEVFCLNCGNVHGVDTCKSLRQKENKYVDSNNGQ